jgi:hypothetical protein
MKKTKPYEDNYAMSDDDKDLVDPVVEEPEEESLDDLEEDELDEDDDDEEDLE